MALLAACSKTDAPVRIDFVGATGLTSGNRTLGAGDTLVTHAYAVGNDQPLKNLRIEVTYEPGPAPILYPIPTSSFDANKAPQPLTITYLDSLLPASSTGSGRGTEALFANGLMARTTSGKETWTYTATDASGQTAARGYHLTVHKSDSAAVFHSYPLILRPLPNLAARPASVRDSRRVFLNLRYGLLLPKYALLNKTNVGANQNSLQGNQKLIDLVAVANQAGTAVSLATPANSANWPTANRQLTVVHAVGLTPTQFTNAANAASFQAAFDASKPYESPAGSTSDKTTGPLAAGQVIAFKAFDVNDKPYYGLLQVTAFTGGTNPLLTCQVKLQKY
ncbi:hypothetical protein GCM10022409_42790 [Hymenobacter glaciei]|uniref:CHRD domain-containing protein n=1 Tax=Hymenobacter glaciei TaxID=877209 RepID=A0ABP7UT64_9BACT